MSEGCPFFLEVKKQTIYCEGGCETKCKSLGTFQHIYNNCCKSATGWRVCGIAKVLEAVKKIE